MAQWGQERCFEDDGGQIRAVPKVDGSPFQPISDDGMIVNVVVIDAQGHPTTASLRAGAFVGGRYADWLTARK